MTAATATDTTAPVAAPSTPKEFVRQLRQLVKSGTPWEVAAYYDRHGAAFAPLLRGRDRLLVADIMHVVDTVTEWKPTPDLLRPPGAREPLPNHHLPDADICSHGPGAGTTTSPAR